MADTGSLSVVSQTASLADVLDDTPVAKMLRSAKRRIIAALDLGFLDEWMDNDLSRNPRYHRSQILHGLLLYTAEVKFRFREIVDCFDSVIRCLICGFDDETPVLSIIWECWNRLQPYSQSVFDRIVQLLDSTHLLVHAPILTVCGCRNQLSRKWVYSYGLLIAVDCASDLPSGVVVV